MCTVLFLSNQLYRRSSTRDLANGRRNQYGSVSIVSSTPKPKTRRRRRPPLVVSKYSTRKRRENREGMRCPTTQLRVVLCCDEILTVRYRAAMKFRALHEDRLCAAALLSSYGKKVVVCEAHTQAGGCAHGFDRGGYKFDSGPSLFSGTVPFMSDAYLTVACRKSRLLRSRNPPHRFMRR